MLHINPALASISLIWRRVNIFSTVCFFYNGSVYIIFIETHLYLHGSGISSKFHMSEMIKEKQNSQSDTNGVGNLKDCKMIRNPAGDLGIDGGKEFSYIYIVVEGHNGKGSAEKCGETYEQDFDPFPQKSGSGFVFVCDDKSRFSYRRDLQIRFFLLDFGDQIHNRKHIASRFVRRKIYYRHDTESIQKFAVAAGQTGNVLQIDMGVQGLDVFVQKQIEGITHSNYPFILGLKIRLARYEKISAAETPTAQALNPPVKRPRNP